MPGFPCPLCGFDNSEDDHRCLQCGRLLPDVVVAAPASYIRPSLPLPAAVIPVTPEIPYSGRVAHPMRRLTAAVIDGAMVILGLGVFGVAARISGSTFGDGAVLWITAAACLISLALFYGLIWALAMCETAGMRWMRMHLVAIDGRPIGARRRAIRFVSTWLSYGSGGLGLLWALADDEGLTIHDILSGTYPAEL